MDSVYKQDLLKVAQCVETHFLYPIVQTDNTDDINVEIEMLEEIISFIDKECYELKYKDFFILNSIFQI